ncbi:MAG: hypothetical protein LBR60_03865 [Fibrobacter sp.]|jgi:hypothetical protein|nr:hypothetical protein [Fibrobacter sp.]
MFIDILKEFYLVHYNFAAIAVLLILGIIVFLTKKNFKGALIALALLIGFNVFIYMKSKVYWNAQGPASKFNNVLVIEEDGKEISVYSCWDKKSSGWVYVKPEKINPKHKEHNCWVECSEEDFANTNVVDKLWAADKAKAMKKASEGELER